MKNNLSVSPKTYKKLCRFHCATIIHNGAKIIRSLNENIILPLTLLFSEIVISKKTWNWPSHLKLSDLDRTLEPRWCSILDWYDYKKYYEIIFYKILFWPSQSKKKSSLYRQNGFLENKILFVLIGN